MPEFQRDMGKLEAKVEHLEEQVLLMNEKLDILNAYMSQVQGGWKLMLAISGLSAAIGGLIVKLLPLTRQ